MTYDLQAVAKLSLEVNQYEFYEQHGTGCQEDPYMSGKVLFETTCSEFEAFMLAECTNIGRFGIMSQRTSWESPKIQYRKKKCPNKADNACRTDDTEGVSQT